MKSPRHILALVVFLALMGACTPAALLGPARLASLAQLAVCEQIGQTNDPTPVPLWKGDCVAAVPVSDTDTPVPATDTPIMSTETSTPEPPTATDSPTTAPSATLEPSVAPTDTATPPDTETATVGPSVTPLPFPSATPGAPIAPFPAALLCPDWGDLHDTTRFHTIWDSVRGCHYDHEHGTDPFVPAVVAAFPGFDLQALGCGQQVGHCSPSSPIENDAVIGKHGGNKWDVNLAAYIGCGGYESSPIGVNAAVIQYHAFGNYAVELNGRIHSAAILMRQCKPSAPNDYGYAYIVQHVDYGQRTVPYQGDVMPYPDNPLPAYDPPRGPYISMDCVGVKDPDSPPERGACRPSLSFVLTRNANANSIWTSKPTGAGGASVQGSKLFNLLFRLRDTYQLLDWADQSYPFTFKWLCSTDSGNTYAALRGCRFNNSTSHVHEIEGTIPAAWDNVVGLDTDMRAGRITADILVSRFGDLMPAGVCLQPGAQCFPVKLVQAFVGKYASELIDGKLTQFSIAAQPERDIYFCGQNVCAEDAPGAVSSGWIGPNN